MRTEGLNKCNGSNSKHKRIGICNTLDLSILNTKEMKIKDKQHHWIDLSTPTSQLSQRIKATKTPLSAELNPHSRSKRNSTPQPLQLRNNQIKSESASLPINQIKRNERTPLELSN
ncbi:hypothetical protein Taro_025678 [Colocasia esculenta]|uniref:Uncharacterized protein n=1 Tax=Colocasia esculenta TaxID=4460 RepID=A0A843VH91_COLES|nr:hypothetical protein [Colocasia esculenta]